MFKLGMNNIKIFSPLAWEVTNRLRFVSVRGKELFPLNIKYFYININVQNWIE